MNLGHYNKATLSALAAAVFVLLAALSVQFDVKVRPETWAAVQGFAQAFISFLVPNSPKEASNGNPAA